MKTTEWDWPTAHQQHDLGETADVLWPSVRPNQRARIGPHPPAVDVASRNFIGIRNPSGSSTYFTINLYPQSGRLFAFLSYFDFDKVANCKEGNRILNGLANETFSARELLESIRWPDGLCTKNRLLSTFEKILHKKYRRRRQRITEVAWTIPRAVATTQAETLRSQSWPKAGSEASWGCPLSSKLNYSAAPRNHFVPAIEIYGRSDNESPVVTLTNCPVGLSTTIRSPSGSLS